MEFDWTVRTVGEWRDWLGKAPRANWMQSWPYAQARHQFDQRFTRQALIRIGGEACGMMAVEEIRLGPLHIVELNRGPLWFTAEPPELWLAEFAALFARTFPARWLRRRRWLPEWTASEKTQQILQRAGFRPTAQSYRTAWVELNRSIADLEADFEKNWRNGLRKAERSGLTTKLDHSGETLDLFLKRYESHVAQKKYRGSSARFIRAEFEQGRPFQDGFLLWAFDEIVPVGAIYVAIHGRTASYRFGWSTDEGRKVNANTLLLARALVALQERRVERFDVGGLLPGEADGLTKFKRGMGGRESELPGIFR